MTQQAARHDQVTRTPHRLRDGVLTLVIPKRVEEDPDLRRPPDEILGALLARTTRMFANRADAGRQLASMLRGEPPIIVGIVRGGVPVAAEIAKVLQAPLEILVVRSLLAPAGPRRVIGAVAERGAMYLDPSTTSSLAAEVVEQQVARELAEVARLATLLRDGHSIDLSSRRVILVDDAIVTEATIRAAIRSLRRVAGTLELAVPVASTSAIERIRPFVDHLHCLEMERAMTAAGARYQAFDAVSEAEVVSLRTEAFARMGSSTAAPELLHHVA